MSHWFTCPPLKRLHTQFPLPRMFFIFPLDGSSFFYRTQPECVSKTTPFLTVTPVLFCNSCLFLPQEELMLFVCLHIFVCLPLQRKHSTMAGTTLDFVIVSPVLGTVHNMWWVLSKYILCLSSLSPEQ